MKKSLKIKNFSFHKRKDHYSDISKELKLVLEFISDKREVNFVESHEDLFLFRNYRDIEHNSFSATHLCINGENLLYYPTLISALHQRLEKINIDIKWLTKWCIQKNINLMIPHKRYNKLYLHIMQNRSPNFYAILSNSLQAKNVLNIPYFMMVGLHRVLLHTKRVDQYFIPKKFCCMIASNLHAVDRLHFALKLSQYKKLDIYGKTFLTNADNSQLPDLETDNQQIFQNYKFVICFENSFADEYITEKLAIALTSPTSIPVYRGASNVSDYFNTKAFIEYGTSQNSYDKMIERIKELDQDDEKFRKVLQEPILTYQNQQKIEAKERDLRNFIDSIVDTNF